MEGIFEAINLKYELKVYLYVRRDTDPSTPRFRTLPT